MAPKYRMAAVKEAPVFHPSAEEFADPLRYIASIRAEAEPCLSLIHISEPRDLSTSRMPSSA